MFWRPASHVQQIGFFNLVHNNGNAGYLDVGVGVTTFLLAGRFFEATAKRRTGNALHSLATVQAKDVAVLDASGAEHRLPIGELRIGDRFVVRPGETIATDGVVITGRSAVDRSLLTGESVPQDVGPGDEVVGGTVSVAGRLVVLASTVGSATQLAQIARLVEDAQNQKAAIQRLGDRIAGIFVPAVLALATFTLVVWLASGGTPDHAFSAALSVLIVACPCAIGLATPTALLVATGRGARLGIFFKGYQGIEISRHIDTVVLDKTGTVTEGRMRVVDVAGAPGVGRAELLRWAGALEQASEHAIAQAITDLAVQELGSLPLVEHFEAEPGLGARGVVGGHQICVGRSELFSTSLSLLETTIAERCSVWQALGRSAVLVGRDDVVVGAIALADTVRPSAAPAVADLQALGLRCLLLTGDNEHTARAVAESIGVTDVIANTLPADKVGVIRRLQQQGRSVAMIGDGINDAPALASADLGIAVGSGTDVAMNAADLIIVRVDLQVAAMAVNLARQTLKTIRRNLLWAFGYNLVALPLAAVGLLNPLIAGAAMALSSSFVVWNSSRLGRQSIRTSM
jgi:cation-transporting P-type ATPase A/B/Cu+-exporting ATPase